MVTLVPSLGVMKGTKQSKKATFSLSFDCFSGSVSLQESECESHSKSPPRAGHV